MVHNRAWGTSPVSKYNIGNGGGCNARMVLGTYVNFFMCMTNVCGNAHGGPSLVPLRTMILKIWEGNERTLRASGEIYLVHSEGYSERGQCYHD